MKKSYIISGTLGLGLLALVGGGVLVGQDLKSRPAGGASDSPMGCVLCGVMDTFGIEHEPSPVTMPSTSQQAYNAPSAKPEPEISARRAPAMAMQESFAGVSAAFDPSVSITPMPPRTEPMPNIENRDQFEKISENAVKSVQSEPVSTFSIDVDTSSYAVVRRALNNGQMPPANAVRTEELINYFDYDYAVPESKSEPFKPTVALYETPWNPDTVLMHVGIKGHELPADAPKPHSNLVFLLDVSGSMNRPDKLPLLKQAFRMLVDNLQPSDTISIVTYAGNAGVVLEPTKVSDKTAILNAIDNLQASGSTAGAQGIQAAYALAQQNFNDEGVNRVILATDGDFNVGMTSHDELEKYISAKRKTGIYLSVLGFGQGNYNDALMQRLAQNGNGNAAYIDSINEARKVLVDEASSTLYPIANDVKIQVEFNPLQVAEYRLIGYENRLLNREDFNNDKIDAGDIGAGHTVTAIYELTPVGSKAQMIDDLRYGEAPKPEAPAAREGGSNEYAFLKMRYKLPGESTSKLITQPITPEHMQTVDSLSDDVRFAGAVAAFGQLLRNESYVANFTYDDVLKLATPARGTDPFNYRGEFLNLVRNAQVAQQR